MKKISLFLIMLMFISTGCYNVKQKNDSQTNSSEYLQVTTASTSNQINSDGTIDSASNQSNAANSTSGASSSIDINKYVVLNFSDTINPATVNASSVYILDANQIPIVSELIVSGNTISIIPIELFLPNQTYTIVITTEVQDVGGKTLESTFIFTFLTVDEFNIPDDDLTAPSLMYLSPANGSTVNKTTNIVMGFDERITGTGFLEVRESGTNSIVPGTLTRTDTSLGFMPQGDLTSGSSYTVTLNNSVEDLLGNIYTGFTSWSFSVTDSPEIPPIEPTPGDTTAPILQSLTPTDGSTVATTTAISMTFDESIAGTGILTLRDTTLGNDVSGVSSISGSRLNFTPTNALIAGNDYTVTLQNSVEDLSGNGYTGLTSWSFSTVPVAVLTVTSVTQAGRTIRVYFSEELDATTVLRDEFLINAGTIAIGQFELSSSDATLVKFVATENLNGTEIITVSGNIQDVYGVNHNGGSSASYPIGYSAP